MSMRGWSGALPNEIRSFPTLEDVRRAICQVRCPERNKETFDAHPLFVSPCVLSTSVYLMQECDDKVKHAYLMQECEDKVKQKSQLRIQNNYCKQTKRNSFELAESSRIYYTIITSWHKC